jgi:hypothetical protein
MAKKIQFSEITLRLEVSHRGGGIEIDLTRKGFKGHKMSAYQNYLGGGMLGKVCVNNTIEAFNLPCTDKQKLKLDKISEELKKYFHELSNSDDEFEKQSYEQNQKMSVSAY